MFSVEAEPVFWIVINTARRPFTRTMLVCGGCPSCTNATSRTRVTAPFWLRMGRSLISSIFVGLAFNLTLYSVVPTFSVPAGTIRF